MPMTMHSEEEIIKDKEHEEDDGSKASSDDCSKVSSDDCSKASSDVCCTDLNLEEDKLKRWYRVDLREPALRDQQRAFLVDILKCDKSEACSIYEFNDVVGFSAFMTKEEANKFAELEKVFSVEPSATPRSRREQTKSRRKIYSVPKIKKRKLSIGSFLSEQRKNREKWRYNEDLEPKTIIEELDETSDDYCSSDSCDGSEFYLPLDDSGKRWYEVSLVNDKIPADQKALLLTTLNCDESEIPSIYNFRLVHHVFEAYMTEEEADKVAGLEEVEFVEPCRQDDFIVLD
ncbi:hypothetical protein REPUB_Repub16aG0154000 [Reevesia pubescens]